jgi:hypothetical protein
MHQEKGIPAMPEKSEKVSIGQCLQQLAMRKVRPTETLYLLIGCHDWITNERAQHLISRSRIIDLSWDAYIIKDDQTRELPGIYMFGPDHRAYRVFELD